MLRPLKQSKSPRSSKLLSHLITNHNVFFTILANVELNKIKAKLKKRKLPSKKKELREKIKSLAKSVNVNAGRETKNLQRKAKL